MRDHEQRRVVTVGLLLGALAWLGGCASRSAPEPAATNRPEQLLAITQEHELIRFKAGQPQRVVSRQALKGLTANERVVGMDFRVARGVLYVLTDQGQLYTADPASGKLTPVGAGAGNNQGPALKGQTVGVDFNPVADRIRVVTASGQNWRLHPDTGAWVDADAAKEGVQGDGALAYAADDTHAASTPMVGAAAYTYNKDNDKLTTNYAIDLVGVRLVMQGSREGGAPVVSPNTGKLRTVGALGVSRVKEVAFDIADMNNAALAALGDGRRTRLYQVDLRTGSASLLGTVGDGTPLLGMAVEP